MLCMAVSSIICAGTIVIDAGTSFNGVSVFVNVDDRVAR